MIRMPLVLVLTCFLPQDRQAQIDEAFKKLETGADYSARHAGAMALGRLRARGSAMRVAGLLRSPSRSEAILALDYIDARDFRQEVGALLRDPNEEISIRWRAINALGHFEAKEYAADIAGFLDHTTNGVRADAAAALGLLGAREYIPRIAALLRDPVYVVRGPAAQALADLGASDHVPAIVELLKGQPLERQHALLALGKFKSRAHGPDMLVEAKVDKGLTRANAILALGYLGMNEYGKELAPLLAARSHNVVRGEILWTLGQLDCREAADQVRALVDDSSPLFSSKDSRQTLRFKTVGAVAKEVLERWQSSEKK